MCHTIHKELIEHCISIRNNHVDRLFVRKARTLTVCLGIAGVHDAGVPAEALRASAHPRLPVRAGAAASRLHQSGGEGVLYLISPIN